MVVQDRSRKHLEGQTDLYEVEYRIRHKNGSIRWLHTCGRVERDEDGRPVRFAGIDWDITARKQAEEEASYERDLMQTLLDNIPDYVYFKDKDRETVTGWGHLSALA